MKFEENKIFSELSQYISLINDATFKEILENCFSVFLGKPEIHPMSLLHYSEPDIVKQTYAFLLTITAQFIRTRSGQDDILQDLKKYCCTPNKTEMYCKLFQKSRSKLIIPFLNIGSYLPHITDVDWKMNYTVKSSMTDEPAGPLFRIALTAKQYDIKTGTEITKDVCFSCTIEELQDLVYKLKYIVRHCYSLSNGIL